MLSAYQAESIDDLMTIENDQEKAEDDKKVNTNQDEPNEITVENDLYGDMESALMLWLFGWIR